MNATTCADLAFEIIGLYPDLVNYHNERGETALHLLANKPLVFPSGSIMGQMDSFIYSCDFMIPLSRVKDIMLCLNYSLIKLVST